VVRSQICQSEITIPMNPVPSSLLFSDPNRLKTEGKIDSFLTLPAKNTSTNPAISSKWSVQLFLINSLFWLNIFILIFGFELIL